MILKKLGIDIQPKDILWTPVGDKLYIVDYIFPLEFPKNSRKAVSGNSGFIIEDKLKYEVFVP